MIRTKKENNSSKNRVRSEDLIPRPELQSLTPREIEVLTLVAKGYTSQEIAKHLVLSIKTVQVHRTHITEKLGLHTIAHLVRFALRHKLVELEADAPITRIFP